jgi:chromosome segregation ATPase
MMSIVEIKGGPITYSYLERKTKSELARVYMDLLSVYNGIRKRCDSLEQELENAGAIIQDLEGQLECAEFEIQELRYEIDNFENCLSWNQD